MSIVTRLNFFAAAVIIGFGQGFQPVCGFSYGARKFARLRKGFTFALEFTTCFGIVVSIVGAIFAREIMVLFRDDPAVITTGIWALRAQCLTFPLSALVVMTNMTLQTTRHTLGAMMVAAGRSGVFLIPPLLVLPRLFGLGGLVWCQAISDVLSFILAVAWIRAFFREIPKQNLVLNTDSTIK